MGTTDFRPQLHGFDFDNRWDLDDNYRNFIRQEIRDALPIAVKVVLTNPGIGAALLGALGAVYGIGEALLPGLFDSIAIPIIVDQIVSAVNDKIDNGLPDHYGLCGGMAFAPLDYYYQQWVIPKGIFKRLIGTDKVPFIVPPGDIPNAAILRNYINQRFDDTWASGGVRDKMVQWYVILKTIPSQFGGGGPEVQNRCKGEWAPMAGMLDQGKPQPIALLFDTWDIFDNHQVVAYGYGGDPFSGSAFINIYDSNNPNQELLIQFDFTQSEMEGKITDKSGNIVTSLDDSGKPVPMYEALKGFFLAIYTPQGPPPSWGIQDGLRVQPSACQSVKEIFTMTATVANSFTFFGDPKQGATVTPVVSDPLTLQVVPPSYQSMQGEAAFQALQISYAVTDSFNYAGDYIAMAKAYLRVVNSTDAVTTDQFGKPLACFRNLPALNSQAVASLHLHVLDRLQIAPVNRSGSSCYFPYAEGADVTLKVTMLPFAGGNVSYTWQVSGAAHGATNTQTLELSDLPAAQSSITVNVKVVNLDTGCIAVGSATITTYSATQAGQSTGVCKLAQIMSHYMKPGLVNPLGPDDRELTQFVQNNISQLRSDAARILQLTGELEAQGRSG